MQKKIEMPVEELVKDHHQEMKERVKGQLKILFKEISEEYINERIRI